MLSWRALGYLLDDAFSEVGTGLYAADELGAVTDEEGRPVIDVTEVAPIDGMQSPAQAKAEERAAAAEAPAPPAELWDLQARLHALPEKQQAEWRERKHKNPRLAGTATAEMTAAQVRLAGAMLRGLEQAAKRETGIDPAEAAALVQRQVATRVIAFLSLTPEEPPSPSEGDPEPGTPDPGPATPEPSDIGPKDFPADVTPADAPDSGEVVDHGLTSGNAEVEPPPPAEPGPTGGDAAALTAQYTIVVDRMSLAAVKKDLRDFKLPTEGGGPTIRARLVHAMVAAMLEQEEPF
jgi:hypothetical protein